MDMNPIFGPVLAQVFLGLIVVLVLGYRRVTAMRTLGFAHIRTQGFPERAVNTNDNLRNQFEIPVLFYVLAFWFALEGTVTTTVLLLAWGFVALRYFHAMVQLTSNTIFPWRFGSFVLSTFAVLGMFLIATAQAVA